MEKVLKKQSVSDWVAKLGSYDVYMPALVEENWSYEVVDGPRDFEEDFTKSLHSPKSIVFPQREVLFTFDHDVDGQPLIEEVLPDPRQFVVFGVRPCDARGLTLTDLVFTKEHKDPYYWARRDRGVFIGLACNAPPSLSCFCLSVGGSPHGEDGLDILMTELADGYYVKALTGKGREIAKLASSLLKAPGDKDKNALKKIRAEAEKHPHRPIDGLNGVADKLKTMFGTPFWDGSSKACIQCGICTFLCPTCHCFDMNDEVTGSSPLKGERVRTWDTCQFPDFTMHSSGHNPRPDNAARLRQRVGHKFQYFFENHGVHQCTGCGRCVAECPVGIDIVAVVNGANDYVG